MLYLNNVSLVVIKAYLRYRLEKNHPDASALILMNYILGDSQISSRLAQELREKNALVYGFGTGLQLDQDTNVGALSISANYTAGRSAQVSASSS